MAETGSCSATLRFDDCANMCVLRRALEGRGLGTHKPAQGIRPERGTSGLEIDLFRPPVLSVARLGES